MPRLDPENCDHSSAHKEMISGQKTGEYVCDGCGESWMSSEGVRAAQAAYETRVAQGKTPSQTLRVPARGKEYEVKVYRDGDGHRVAGYLAGEQVTMSYSVTTTTNFDFHTFSGEWALDHLISAVKKDIADGHVSA